MTTLPVAIDHDLNGGIVVYAEERAAVLNMVMDVAATVAPTALAHIAAALHEYHESAGTSAAAALDRALEDVPDRVAVSVLKLTPEEAIALGSALTRYGIEALGGDAA